MSRSKLVKLDAELKSPSVQQFEAGLRARVIGQERAVRTIASLYQVLQAGLNSLNRPIGAVLFLGPTGSGKTRAVEAAAEVLFSDPRAVIKIDCAEFQHSHEIAKLIGSPPGYLGHRETQPLLSQENLDRFQTERDPLSLVLFDEIEKASEALWHLLLGILDKATLTLGDNRRVDFSQAMIFMTSNLGAKEMSELVTGSIGFAPARSSALHDEEVDQKIYRLALEAARRRFSPEFMNRLDKVIVFRKLKELELAQILNVELKEVQRRVSGRHEAPFTFELTEEAKRFLLTEGTSNQYGARHLKRAIERFLVYPLSNLLATGQVLPGDLVIVDFNQQKARLAFYRQREATGKAPEAAPNQEQRLVAA
jgi:ATP-dependent Clp protease ATP-binding subunit ClpA